MQSKFTSRAHLALVSAGDLAWRLLWYDRKEDEQLPEGQIEEAVRSGELTLDDIVEAFRAKLESALPPPRAPLGKCNKRALGLSPATNPPPPTSDVGGVVRKGI